MLKPDLGDQDVMRHQERSLDDPHAWQRRAETSASDPWVWFHLAARAEGANSLADAIDGYNRCLQLSPYYDIAYERLAHIYEQQSNDDALLAVLKRWDEFVPGIADVRFRIGTTYLKNGYYKAARQWFDRGLNSIVVPQGQRLLPYGQVTAPRLLHDLTQINWLIKHKYLPLEFGITSAVYQSELDRASKASLDWVRGQPWLLDSETLLRLSGFYRRCITLAEADRITPDAIGMHSWNEIEKSYLSSRVEERYVVIDNLLSQKALKRLWHYCQASTIWHNDGQKGRNYLGAYQLSGFRPPLIDQMSFELCERLPNILGDIRLEQVWAYRTVRGSSAIGVHADFALVNLNLWITPDSANSLPGRGGLVLYKRAVPQEMTFKQYNDDEANIQSMIADSEKVVIPYRCNRAILFDSRLFHGSDQVSFRDGFDSNRINITLLFGKR